LVLAPDEAAPPISQIGRPRPWNSTADDDERDSATPKENLRGWDRMPLAEDAPTLQKPMADRIDADWSENPAGE